MKDRRDDTATRPRNKARTRPVQIMRGPPADDRIPRDTLVAFSAHRTLPRTTAKLLRLQYDEYLRAGDAGRATRLARLSASDAAAGIAAELNKDDRNRENNKHDRNREDKRKYLRPSVWAKLWRDPRSRRELRRMVQDHPQRRLVLKGLRMWADEEAWMRTFQLAKLLIEQVELAARPLRPEEIDRLIDSERQRAEHLRRAGIGTLACIGEQMAARLEQNHEKDFRTEDERADAMVYAAARRLVWHFAMRGDRLVATLVGAELEREFDPRRVRYLAIRG